MCGFNTLFGPHQREFALERGWSTPLTFWLDPWSENDTLYRRRADHGKDQRTSRIIHNYNHLPTRDPRVHFTRTEPHPKIRISGYGSGHPFLSTGRKIEKV